MEEKIKEQKRKPKSRKGTFNKVRNTFGVYDVYKLIRKNHWFDIGHPVPSKDYYTIIRGVNKYLAENIVNGDGVNFPESMGSLELRKYATGVSLVNGILKNTYPIDWGSTLDLWLADEEEKKKKTLIRFEVPNRYYVKYNKDKANYENKIFYKFDLNRTVKVALKDNINKGKTDALW